MKTLVTWLGQHDLGSLSKDKTNGPIWSAVSKENFEKVIIIQVLIKFLKNISLILKRISIVTFIFTGLV